MSWEEYNTFINGEWSILGKSLKTKYFKMAPKFVGDQNNYKEQALHYLKSTIKLLKSRSADEIITIDRMKNALTNVYRAQGNPKQEAIEKSEKEIKRAVHGCHLLYDETARNCFATEPYGFNV